MIIKRSLYTYNVNRVTHCSAEDSMLSYDKHAHQEPCLKPRQPGVCSVHERKASTHVPLFMQRCVSHSKRTTRVRVSTSTEVVSRFSAVIPHNFFFVVQRGTPQVSTTKGRSCTSTRSRQQTRHVLQHALQTRAQEMIRGRSRLNAGVAGRARALGRIPNAR